MADLHDFTTRATATDGKRVPPYLVTTTDKSRTLHYVSSDGLVERADGHIAESIKTNGAATTFTIGSIPANCIVKTVTFSVTTGAATNSITAAVGIAGTTGKYMTATSFGTTMDTAGVKTVTSLPIHETTAQTVLLTLAAGAATDTTLRATVSVQYIKVPAPLA